MKKILFALFFLVSSIFAFDHVTSKNIDEKISGKNVILEFYRSY